MPSPALLVLDDARHVGLLAAELVANRVRARTHLRMLLPTGHTPRGLYAVLRDHVADGSLPTEHVTVLGLDEYLGPGADDPRSFRAALDRELAGMPLAQREALDGAARDPAAECVRYQAVLDAAPIDLAVLGLGRDAVVLTGYTHTGGLSEAEQMQREWPLADVPVLLEVAGRNTAENASPSLPIVLAMGITERVNVVTSVWHLRAPYFFAPYRAFGFELDMRPGGPRADRRGRQRPAGHASRHLARLTTPRGLSSP
jgi:hypothetical protein